MPRACCRICQSWCCIPSRSQGEARWMCLRISCAWWRNSAQCWWRSCPGLQPGRPGQPCTVMTPSPGAMGASAGWAIPSDKGAAINAPANSSRLILWWIMACLDLLDPMVTRRTFGSSKAFHTALSDPSRAQRVNRVDCTDRRREKLFHSTAIIAWSRAASGVWSPGADDDDKPLRGVQRQPLWGGRTPTASDHRSHRGDICLTEETTGWR
jgi:hypothetical protein